MIEQLNLATTGFDSLLKSAIDIKNESADYFVSKTGKNNFTYDPFFGKLRYLTDDNITRESQMSDYSFSQLCGKLGIPVNYMNKCKAEGKIELIGDNLDAWIDGSGKDLMVREYKGAVRGVLSKRYSVFDSDEILSIVGDQFSNYSVKGSYISPERLHVRAIDVGSQLGIAGEDLFAGIQIDSSDVGRNTLVVRSFIYKQVCTNGLMMPTNLSILFKQKHIGISREDFAEGVAEGFKQHPLHIACAVDAINKAKEAKITLGDSTNKVLKDFVLLGEKDIEKVNDLITNSYGDNVFGLVNAITEVAQVHTLERRVQLEELAGSLMVRMVA